jgi:uncharacterized RDD family membrane protein YckC
MTAQDPDGASRPPASFGVRVISFLIDYVAPLLILGVLFLIGFVVNSLVLTIVLGAVGCFGVLAFLLSNSCYQQGITGQSFGRRLTRTMLVKIGTGAPIGFGTALLRQVCHLVEFGIGFLWPLWDRRRQTFADKIVGSIVVHVEDRTERRTHQTDQSDQAGDTPFPAGS